ncbi:MAG: hypothetical protein SOY67_04385 [Collinsella sp.]|nr:hypothetical protein [Collinsella sp.]
MLAKVTSPYTDRLTGEPHNAGDEVELTAERFGELERGGFVAPAGDGEDGSPDLSSLTVAQLKGYIDARGGSYGGRDAKARLVEIAEAL